MTIPSFFLLTLGCAKNAVDSAAMVTKLLQSGFSETEDPEQASVIIVNTCSFIQSATEESLEAIFDLAGLPSVEAGSVPLIVAGCMPARYGGDLELELTEANAFVPCSKEDDIASIAWQLVAHHNPDIVPKTESSDDLSAAGALAAISSDQKLGESGIHRSLPSAYVKISDGCDRRCSYCTIPDIRGAYHSFTLESILADIDQQVTQGAQEICLIAQDTGRWGQDFTPTSSLAELLDTIATHFPETWFRILYLQPEGVTDELLEVMASHENICNYLDIPLQHVVPSLLRAMHRRGSADDFKKLFERIQTRIPDITLRTTFIAGFPGETEEDFQELCDFLEESPLHYVGVFAYSREENTPAFDLPDQLDEETKQERAQQLRDLADALCVSRVAERVDSSTQVLIEGAEDDGQLFGRAVFQAPEVDGVIYVDQGSIGSIVPVTIIDSLFYDLEGEVQA